MTKLESDLTPEQLARVEASPFYNDDLAPVGSADRKWGLWNIAALWVGMSVCIPTYMLASSLIKGGMSWWQAILTVFVGNLVVVVPMILNAHAGTKFGITFPVFARASFGLRGANLAGILRAFVACGWFGIQTWIGGSAIYQLALIAAPGLAESPVLPLLSNASIQVNAAQFGGFLLFWVINVGLFSWKGMDSIRYVENWGAPLLIVLGLALLVWAYVEADGFGTLLSQPSRFETNADFWKFFFPSLTAMVAFWATLSLNIPDFTREARSQKDQALGQLLGLNTTMPLYAFIGVAVTSATVVIYGEAIWDPIALLAKFDSAGVMLISMFALTLATLTTNLAANVVSPAASFSNLAPRLISLRTGCVLTGLIGIAIMPWKLLALPEGYIYTWLIAYSALLGPIGGILICDYFVLRRTNLELDQLYAEGGHYHYLRGVNPAAIIALVLAIAPNVLGFLGKIDWVDEKSIPLWMSLYDYAWFIGFAVAFVVYYVLMALFQTERTRP